MHPDRRVRPFLYLPVEIASRELDAKLLVAYFATQSGFETIIGWKRLMNRNLAHVPPGIVLFKTLTLKDGIAMRAAKAAGHLVAAIDEEVPGLVATKQKLRWVKQDAIAACDLILACGREHEQALLRYFPDSACKISVVGNPRWDLLRPELVGSQAEEAAAIRQRYAPFILVNTNFGFLNSTQRSVKKTTRWFAKTGRVDLSKPEDALFLDEVLAMERANTDAVRDLLRALPARFPDHRFIIRPHPIERAETWSEFLRDVPRAAMVRQGAAVPWILAADALLHTNCTTGVEAFALGKPAISIEPAALGIYEIYLSNRINYVARSADEAMALLARAIESGEQRHAYPPAFTAAFEHNFAASQGAFAAERILDAIAAAAGIDKEPDHGAPRWRPLPGYLSRIRTRPHHAQVMPGIDAPTIAGILQRYARALGSSPNVRVEPCGQLTFHLHASATSAEHRMRGEVAARLSRLLSSLLRGAGQRKPAASAARSRASQISPTGVRR